MNLFKSHITRLVDFAGRENRKPFWLWYLIVYGSVTALNTIAMLPVMLWYVGRIAALTPQPDATGKAPPPDPAVVFGAMMPMFRIIFGVMVIVMLVYVALLAAAVVRRMHDSNSSGWWAAPSLAFQVVLPVVLAFAMPFMMGQAASLPNNAPP